MAQQIELTGWYQQFNSLVDYYAYFSQQFANNDAFVQFGSTLIYGKMWRLAQKLAGFLQRKNVQKGDRVALIFPNCLPYPVCTMAAQCVGGVVLNLNPEYTIHELETHLKDASPRVIIVLDCFAAKVAEVLKTIDISAPTVIVASLGDLLPAWKRVSIQVLLYVMQRIPRFYIPNVISFREALLAGEKTVFSPIKIEKTDVAFLQYTGGTTGIVKAAMLTHGNLLANLEQTHLLFGHSLEPGKEVSIFALPMYHIFSLTVNFLLAMGLGVKHILIADPRQLASLIKQVKNFSVTMIIGVNTLFDKLMQHPHFSQLNLSKLKLVVAGGMAVTDGVAKKWQEKTGVPILQGYGLTETSPCVCMSALTSEGFNGSIGKPLAATEVIFLDDQQHVMPEGDIGELAIRGPQVMRCYWQQPEETRQAFTPDGFLLTGDLGFCDKQGFIYLKERKKDMIDISGLKVYPSEVEEVLLAQPNVVEAAVVGEKTASGNEMVVAYVVRNDPQLLEQELIHACRKDLIAYKIPKRIYFCESLPKSNVGKILKRELRNK